MKTINVTFEDEEFEKALVVMQRNSPFPVVIVDIQLIACSPMTTSFHDSTLPDRRNSDHAWAFETISIGSQKTLRIHYWVFSDVPVSLLSVCFSRSYANAVFQRLSGSWKWTSPRTYRFLELVFLAQ